MMYTKVITIVTVLMFQQITSGEKEYVISLEHNAFDDQYVGCEKAMEIKAKELLVQEKAINLNFSKVWENAKIKWNNTPPSHKRMDMLFEVAVIAYTMETDRIYPAFNRAVRECCASRDAYMNNFHFKAFHFYLTRAVQMLKGSCRTVYRGISVKQHPDGTGEMRFGQFASTSLNEIVARRFTYNSGTLYKVHTCEGAAIEHLSAFPKEREVLIPPYEVFSISLFSDSEGLNNVEVQSKNTFKSRFNCAYLEANKASVPGHLTTILFSGNILFTLIFQDYF